MAIGQNIDALATTLLRTCENEDVTFFVGAGISLEAPANLPTANDLKWRILESLAGQTATAGDRPLLQEYLGAHMLELFIQDLKETLGSGAADVLDIFRAGDPNLYHRLIARLAKRGLLNRVITTNFDCLIERALAEEGVEYHALTSEHDFAEAIVKPEHYSGFQVIKLHGTVAFMDGDKEIPGFRDVKAISPLKLEIRKLTHILEREGIRTCEYGLNRTISAEETLIGSLDRLGLSLSEVTAELLIKYLQHSTVIVIGWSGFDLDIAPLFVEHAAKVLWVVHSSAPFDNRRAEPDSLIDNARRELRSRGVDETRAEMVLLVQMPGYPLDVLPTPEKECAQIIGRSPESKQINVFTPDLIRRIWSRFDLEGWRPESGVEGTKSWDLHFTISRWGELVPEHLPLRWALGRFFLNHGEYDSTHLLLKEVIDNVAGEGCRTSLRCSA